MKQQKGESYAINWHATNKVNSEGNEQIKSSTDLFAFLITEHKFYKLLSTSTESKAISRSKARWPTLDIYYMLVDGGQSSFLSAI